MGSLQQSNLAGNPVREAKEAKTFMRSTNCAFCGGPKKCAMMQCKALRIQCRSCKLFGHYDRCCSDFTKLRGRKTIEIPAKKKLIALPTRNKADNVDEEDECTGNMVIL